MIRTMTLAALAILIVPVLAHAQAPAARTAVNDPLFANAAALSGLAEVALSELGMQKATDPELKRFSEQMVADHTRMNAELTALAARKAYPLARALDARAQFCNQSLAGLTGEKFDQCYAKAQLVAHMEAVATFEAEAERGQDSETRELAAKALPKIKEHLRMIKPIAKRFEKEEPAGNEGASKR